ncbi:MAG: hypothetical protein MHMPM18_002826, partial [Marteilia pararefringens]
MTLRLFHVALLTNDRQLAQTFISNTLKQNYLENPRINDKNLNNSSNNLEIKLIGSCDTIVLSKFYNKRHIKYVIYFNEFKDSMFDHKELMSLALDYIIILHASSMDLVDQVTKFFTQLLSSQNSLCSTNRSQFSSPSLEIIPLNVSLDETHREEAGVSF